MTSSKKALKDLKKEKKKIKKEEKKKAKKELQRQQGENYFHKSWEQVLKDKYFLFSTVFEMQLL